MTLEEYQERAMETCMPSCDNFSYMFLNLVGEVGEFASKVAKDIRKSKAVIGKDYTNDLSFSDASHEEWMDRVEAYMLEAGDILWQLSGLCHAMGWSLEDVAEMNLEKLASRAERGKIDGDGDYR